MIIVASCGHYSDDERIYYKQIDALKKISNSIEYFTYNQSKNIISDNNINHHHFNSIEYSQFEYKRKLLKFIKDNNPVVLHIHDLELLPVARKIKLFNKDIKIIYDVHEDLVSMWDAFSSYSGIIKKIINNTLSKFQLYHLRYIDCFILANKFADRKRYEKFAPIHIIQNFPKKNNILDKTDVDVPYKLIYHGQLDYNRGIVDMIDAFNKLSNRYNQLELKIIGTPRKEGFNTIINDKVKKNKKIELIKAIPHADIWDILYNSHIGVIPFYDMPMFQKNTPTKLFEFMATGCGVVSSKLQPIYEFSPDHISFSRPGDVNSLIGAIEFYLNNVDIYKKHMAHNKELIKKQYNWEYISDQFLNIYKDLLS